MSKQKPKIAKKKKKKEPELIYTQIGQLAETQLEVIRKYMNEAHIAQQALADIMTAIVSLPTDELDLTTGAIYRYIPKEVDTESKE